MFPTRRETREIQSIRRAGEIKQSQMLNAYMRNTIEPEFTNDLCGDPGFFPYYQNEKQWIMLYRANQLLADVECRY